MEEKHNHPNLNSPLLKQARNLYESNPRIYRTINAALHESEAYAADELVELAEEVLNQIAAVGFVHYLQNGNHKEVYNDFLAQLFNSSGHDYNAGPLFRWAANMVLECPQMQKSPNCKFFWQVTDNTVSLAHRVQQLSELRNSVMHGFFVLPPERNRKEAEVIGQLLIDLSGDRFFDVQANYHFFQNGVFTGQWNIKDEIQWESLFSEKSFGRMARRVREEHNNSFWQNEHTIISSTRGNLPENNKGEIHNFVSKNTRGAFAVWVHPTDKHADEYFASTYHELSAIPNSHLIAYNLNDQGINYTGNFLIKRLLDVLDPDGKNKSKNKKTEETLVILRRQLTKKIIVLINHAHLALFSPQHVTRINNLLYDNQILFVAMGHHYECLNTIFNASTQLEYKATLPDIEQTDHLLKNYLRFKGPSHEKSEDLADVLLLKTILIQVLKELAEGTKLYARRFADANNYPIEYVYEIFAVLHPWIKSGREPFEADEVDELYGFPTTMTEATPIYLALGRRDIKLEYLHKVISL